MNCYRCARFPAADWDNVDPNAVYGGGNQDDGDLFDPTLEDDFRQEQELIMREVSVKRTLRTYDTVAEKEQLRRDLVAGSAAPGIGYGVRDGEGKGEYPALAQLRFRQQRQRPGERDHERDPAEEKKSDGSYSGDADDGRGTNDGGRDDDEDDDDDDDEFDYLLDEDLPGQSEELRAFEERRRLELGMEILQKERALVQGYGVHREVEPSRVLVETGLDHASSARSSLPPPPAVVLHLYDPSSTASASLDLYLESLSETARGTKFVRACGKLTTSTAPDLTRQLLPSSSGLSPAPVFLPALVAIRDGVVVNVCPRLRGLVEADAGSPSPDSVVVAAAAHQWLRCSGVLLTDPPRFVTNPLGEESKQQEPPRDGDGVGGQEERFDCGVEGCNKSFAHVHVGVKNEQQDGLVVPEADVVSKCLRYIDGKVH